MGAPRPCIPANSRHLALLDAINLLHEIRVREKPLELISPTDVSVAVTLNAKPTTDAVLSKIQSALAISSNKIDAYLKAKKVQNKKTSEAFILETSHRKQQREIDRLSNLNTRDEYF